jgi:hypothetical protein
MKDAYVFFEFEMKICFSPSNSKRILSRSSMTTNPNDYIKLKVITSIEAVAGAVKEKLDAENDSNLGRSLAYRTTVPEIILSRQNNAQVGVVDSFPGDFIENIVETCDFDKGEVIVVNRDFDLFQPILYRKIEISVLLKAAISDYTILEDYLTTSQPHPFNQTDVKRLSDSIENLIKRAKDLYNASQLPETEKTLEYKANKLKNAFNRAKARSEHFSKLQLTQTDNEVETKRRIIYYRLNTSLVKRYRREYNEVMQRIRMVSQYGLDSLSSPPQEAGLVQSLGGNPYRKYGMSERMEVKPEDKVDPFSDELKDGSTPCGVLVFTRPRHATYETALEEVRKFLSGGSDEVQFLDVPRGNIASYTAMIEYVAQMHDYTPDRPTWVEVALPGKKRMRIPLKPDGDQKVVFIIESLPEALRNNYVGLAMLRCIAQSKNVLVCFMWEFGNSVEILNRILGTIGHVCIYHLNNLHTESERIAAAKAARSPGTMTPTDSGALALANSGTPRFSHVLTPGPLSTGHDISAFRGVLNGLRSAARFLRDPKTLTDQMGVASGILETGDIFNNVENAARQKSGTGSIDLMRRVFRQTFLGLPDYEELELKAELIKAQVEMNAADAEIYRLHAEYKSLLSEAEKLKKNPNENKLRIADILRKIGTAIKTSSDDNASGIFEGGGDALSTAIGSTDADTTGILAALRAAYISYSAAVAKIVKIEKQIEEIKNKPKIAQESPSAAQVKIGGNRVSIVGQVGASLKNFFAAMTSQKAATHAFGDAPAISRVGAHHTIAQAAMSGSPDVRYHINADREAAHASSTSSVPFNVPAQPGAVSNHPAIVGAAARGFQPFDRHVALFANPLVMAVVSGQLQAQHIPHVFVTSSDSPDVQDQIINTMFNGAPDCPSFSHTFHENVRKEQRSAQRQKEEEQRALSVLQCRVAKDLMMGAVAPCPKGTRPKSSEMTVSLVKIQDEDADNRMTGTVALDAARQATDFLRSQSLAQPLVTRAAENGSRDHRTEPWLLLTDTLLQHRPKMVAHLHVIGASPYAAEMTNLIAAREGCVNERAPTVTFHSSHFEHVPDQIILPGPITQMQIAEQLRRVQTRTVPNEVSLIDTLRAQGQEKTQAAEVRRLDGNRTSALNAAFYPECEALRMQPLPIDSSPCCHGESAEACCGTALPTIRYKGILERRTVCDDSSIITTRSNVTENKPGVTIYRNSVTAVTTAPTRVVERNQTRMYENLIPSECSALGKGLSFIVSEEDDIPIVTDNRHAYADHLKVDPHRVFVEQFMKAEENSKKDHAAIIGHPNTGHITNSPSPPKEPSPVQFRPAEASPVQFRPAEATVDASDEGFVRNFGEGTIENAGGL